MLGVLSGSGAAHEVSGPPTIAVQLTDFSVFYNQDSIKAAEAALADAKKAGSKIVVEKGQIVKVSKDARGIVKREVLTEKWSDWVDYGAVDYDYESKREIIRVPKEPRTKVPRTAVSGSEESGTKDTAEESVEDAAYSVRGSFEEGAREWEERWTGEYIFENEWQSFRTKKERTLEFISAAKEVEPGRRKIAVKVVDIFGNDTMTIVEVNVPNGKRKEPRTGKEPRTK